MSEVAHLLHDRNKMKIMDIVGLKFEVYGISSTLIKHASTCKLG